MAQADFFSDDGRARMAAAIGQVEAQTSAEIVLQVKPASGRYREGDYLAGAALAMVALLVLLYAPWDVLLHLFPLVTIVAFVAGALVASKIPALRIAMVPRPEAARQVYQAARAAFHDLRIARTSGRWGLLIVVSALERRVEVVTDLGIDVAALGEPWQGALAAMQSAVERDDLAAFLAAFARLGPALGAVIPHRLDDVDELPNALAANDAGDVPRAGAIAS